MLKRMSLDAYLSILINFGTLFCLYLLNRFTPMIADDYDYSFIFWTNQRLENINDIVISMSRYYMLWGGRLVPQTLAQVFLLFDGSVFDVVNSIAGVAFINCIYFLSVGRQNRKHRHYNLCVLLIIFLLR